MNKSDIQRYWDESLIKHHRLNGRMYDVIQCFLEKMGADHLIPPSSANWGEIYPYISDLKLKRCRDRLDSGELRLQVRPKTYVSVFIGARCVQLNLCLINKENSERDILLSINQFKWIRKTPVSWRKLAKKARERKKEKAEIVIRARDLSKQHDWGTVK